MTIGHPDFQAYAQWRGAPIVSNPALGLGPGGINLGITPIGHYAALTVRVSSVNRNVTLTATFYADAGGVVTVSQVGFTIQNGGTLSVNVPALGPYVQVVVNNLGAAGGSMAIFVQPSNLPASKPGYIAQAGAGPLIWGSASVAASGSLTLTTAEVYAGQVGYFAGTSSGTAFHGTVNYFDSGALAFQTIAGFSGSVGGQRLSALMAAPPSILQIFANNDDSVARTLTLALMSAGQ